MPSDGYTNSSNQYYQNLASAPQGKYTSDQQVLDIDFDSLYSQFVLPIDAIRSHFNAIANNAQELNTPQYQESRVNAFYRMIGFPVVNDNDDFYSPGYDPNLNTDADSLASYQKIASDIASNQDLTSQFNKREGVPTFFSTLWASSGINAQAVAFGSVFIRAFDKQFGNTDPLVFDPSQVQIINDRVSVVQQVFADPNTNVSPINSSILTSMHYLKPFVVDPRFDNSIRPIVNRICAPFLQDKAQTKIFQSKTGNDGNLMRPLIEYVITTRFNNSNVTLNPGQAVVQNVINQILSNTNQTDASLVNATSDPLGQLYSSELSIFQRYVGILQIIIENLVIAIKQIQYTRQKMNFKPIPSIQNGIESGNNGGSVNPVDPNDTANNLKIETDLITLMQKQVLSDISFDTGLQGVPDPGDFAFSNLDDLVFLVSKNVQTSFQDNINNLNNIRNQMGTEGITYLQNIEIIMGEFSGIGLIDIVIIQAALWIMDPSSLLGLIDTRAFDRMQQYRSDINLNGTDQNDINSSLENFETTVKELYQYAQGYYNNLLNGTAFTS